jgi:hypothetical protein
VETPTRSAESAASSNDARQGRKRTAEEAGFASEPEARKENKYSWLCGRMDPKHTSETLMAQSADHELGLPTGMVTMTQNDSSPELLAHARRGPCAVPTEEERFEYLLTRRPLGSRRPRIQEDATAATLSFQRRNHVQKQHFLKRYTRTPLGITTDYWNRKEAQKRQALHSHTPYWSKRRKLLPEGYKPRPSIPKREARAAGAVASAPGTDGAVAATAPQSSVMNKEDDVY